MRGVVACGLPLTGGVRLLRVTWMQSPSQINSFNEELTNDGRIDPDHKTTDRSEQGVQRRWQKFQQTLQIVEGVRGHAFRFLALLFVVGVETALIVAVFRKIDVGAGILTAITIIAVLPILVIRAFDISVLNLGKEGIQADFQVEKLRTEVNEALSKVDRLFALTMSESLFRKLSSLSGEQPISDTVDENVKRQLSYLADIGYVEFVLNKLPESG